MGWARHALYTMHYKLKIFNRDMLCKICHLFNNLAVLYCSTRHGVHSRTTSLLGVRAIQARVSMHRACRRSSAFHTCGLILISLCKWNVKLIVVSYDHGYRLGYLSCSSG